MNRLRRYRSTASRPHLLGPALLLMVLSSAGLANSAGSQARDGRGRAVFDLDGRFLGTTLDLQSTFGGTFASAHASPSMNVQFSPGATRVHVTIPNTGTPWAEEFLAFIPSPAVAPGSSPLLILFHGAGQWPTNPIATVSVEDLAAPIINDALARDWHVLIPLGGHTYNFGHADGQLNTQIAMEAFMGMFGSSIDLTRVYGYGHSMGGGWMLAQAGMRSGIDDLRFAALFANAGTPSNAFTYGTAINPGALDIIFGASPSADPFAYSRSSGADIASTYPFHTDSDLAPVRNLQGTPIRSETCWWDRLMYRIAAHSLHNYLDTHPAPSRLATPNCSLPYHNWRTPDNVEVLDWLSGHTLADPDPQEPHSLLIDRSAQVQYFQLHQRAEGQFSKLQYQLFAAIPNDKLVLLEPENLSLVSFSAGQLGITVAPDFEILVNSGGSVGPDITVVDVTAPQAVERYDGSNWSPVPFTSLPGGGLFLEGSDNPPPPGGATAHWRIIR